ncbi:GDSL esterase/lipase-like protein [Salvia divinorum]|uniref:GDSL esterase/lipase-like protein n=1 Tax=Salvia divinorum TaxID=28513 RepID=A0ABD1FT79_SALDI
MSDKEIFNISGPYQLPLVINWSNFRDQKSVAASLVRGAYVLEHDQLKNRQGNEALAPPWWEAFGFELSKELIVAGDDGSTIFGAVYHRNQNHHHRHQPSCVVAFRGTNTKDIAGFVADTKLNFRIWRYTLEKTDRFQKALTAVRDAVNDFGIESVWIAGHSLGAAIALLVGKNMAKGHDGGNPYPLKAFLFNPPFVGSTNRIGRSLVGVLAEACKSDGETAFAACSLWHPYLFVHPKDLVCRGYIKYFHRRRIPTAQYTFRGLLLRAESTHLIPSAVLVVNHTPAPPPNWKHVVTYWKEAHGIYQWWRTHIELEAHLYTFDPIQPFSREEVAV